MNSSRQDVAQAPARSTSGAVRFMVSRDVRTARVGDAVVSRLIMGLAAEAYSVSAVALSLTPDEPVAARSDAVEDLDVVRVRRAPFSVAHTGLRALKLRRSVFHAEHDEIALRRFLEDDTSAKFVAEHCYMAESFLRVRPADSGRLYVNTHLCESELLRHSDSPLRRLEGRRLARDERRVTRSAARVACFDRPEYERYRAVGPDPVLLRLALPPRPAPPSDDWSQHLLFLGPADWRPNRVAVERLLRMWPTIRAQRPDARLLVVGAGMDQSAFAAVEGVQFLGFVEDLTPVLRGAAAMIAPLAEGGGVRVKFLEAAAAGLPFLGSAEAVGSLGEYLPTAGLPDDEMIEQACRLLSDRPYRNRRADELYDANRQVWLDRVPHRGVADWLA